MYEIAAQPEILLYSEMGMLQQGQDIQVFSAALSISLCVVRLVQGGFTGNRPENMNLQTFGLDEKRVTK